jgi:hypothetical protein
MRPLATGVPGVYQAATGPPEEEKETFGYGKNVSGRGGNLRLREK